MKVDETIYRKDTITNTKQKDELRYAGRSSEMKSQSQSKSICTCPENDGLYKFLEKLRQSEKRRAPNSQFHFTIQKAARSIQKAETAIKTFEEAKKVQYIGDKIAGRIANYLSQCEENGIQSEKDRINNNDMNKKENNVFVSSVKSYTDENFTPNLPLPVPVL